MKRIRIIGLVFLDALAININYILALYLRFDGMVPAAYKETLFRHLLVLTTIKLFVFAGFRMYKAIWRYATTWELIRVLGGALVANLLAAGFMLSKSAGLPRSIYPIALLLDIFLLGGLRIIPKLRNRMTLGQQSDIIKNVMIIGAGEAGRLVLQELNTHREMGYRPVVFIDDDPEKRNRTIGGVVVGGGREEIPKLAKKYDIDEIIIAMPSAEDNVRQDILDIASDVGVKVRIVPGVYEMIDGHINLMDIRDIEIDDLLGRDEIHLDTCELEGILKDQVVLVTGGGGTIGSELARQIAGYQPKQLILLDIYENTTYTTQNELRKAHPDLDLVVLIDSVRERDRMDQVFEKYKPKLVFHAAAHKHVPLMEGSPHSAVMNNVFGTLNVALAADKYGVERFVLISTDKAVNPTNIMGATKRICEMITQSFNQLSDTSYVSVRFGNVLGSSGSVIPLFLKQINEGGPVTVTHKDIIRYFMSIPEASQLVLQAGAIAKGGEVFVLDMGEPVKIADLAKKLIKLKGFEPDKDIKIEYVGLRPGEKLYEELLVDEDSVDSTSVERIYVEKPETIDFHELELKLIPLREAAMVNDRERVVYELEQIVPNFKNYVPGEEDEA